MDIGEMKIIVLIENTTDGSLTCEHGLSLWIECNGRTILLDSGQSEAFYKNAGVLGISFDGLDACVLSHGHYDHSGGFAALFRNNPTVKVYAQRSALIPHYSAKGGMHEIGIPGNVLAYHDRFELVDSVKEILEDVWLIPHDTPGLDRIGEEKGFYLKKGDGFVPDDFSHEQSLVFVTGHGLVIFNSCSHGGIANIIREARDACGGAPVYAYIGGLHMKGLKYGLETCTFSEAELDALCDVIRKENICYVYTGHCTGRTAYDKLRQRLGDILYSLTTGLQFT
ncbi:MAG: MBL fold metallo-hydrolase [Clostridiales bacterium]|nr:MBL fold metallo-hydrolase [Clostridiales bacterium]